MTSSITGAAASARHGIAVTCRRERYLGIACHQVAAIFLESAIKRAGMDYLKAIVAADRVAVAALLTAQVNDHMGTHHDI